MGLLELIYPLGLTDAVNLHLDQTLEDHYNEGEDITQIWDYLPVGLQKSHKYMLEPPLTAPSDLHNVEGSTVRLTVRNGILTINGKPLR